MGKLIMWNLLSLDGFFEGPKSWQIDWFQPIFNDELERISLDQLRGAGMLMFGRVTYEGMAAYWQTATGDVAEYMNDLPKIVYSRTLDRVDWTNSRLAKSDDADEVRRLKTQTEGDIYVFGSGKLSEWLMGNGLFDEYRLCIVPLILGAGNHLFRQASARTNLKLLDARALSNGCAILRYIPQPDR